MVYKWILLLSFLSIAVKEICTYKIFLLPTYSKIFLIGSYSEELFLFNFICCLGYTYKLHVWKSIYRFEYRLYSLLFNFNVFSYADYEI